MSEMEKYQNLCRETEVVGQAHDLLMTGRFPGGAAQTLAVAQGYLKGLYNHLKAECDKLAPLPLPKVDEDVRDAIPCAIVDPTAALK